MNIFIRGLDWKAGDEVVYCTHEHGGGIQPLLQVEARYGVKLVKIEVPSPPESVDQIVKIYERAMTAKTRLIMVSHMTYVTGLITPIKALADLAHSKGALISVDGAHPLGMLDLDLKAHRHRPLRRGGAEMAAGRHRHRRLLREARRAGSRSGR